jgi:copper homeostasis protein
VLLEIAVFNFQSAVLAENAGADRLELCADAFEGGTTQSYGVLKMVREKISIPVFPIIRPRGGDFLFSDEEFQIMKKEIGLCKELQFEGVVIGALHADGTIHKDYIAALTDLAYPLEVTFHRAFDRAKDPLQALEDIINCGCTRILTSGQVPNAFDGKELIKELIVMAEDRIIILPGSGVRSGNISALSIATGAVEFHSSARMNVDSKMIFQQSSMNENLQDIIVDQSEIRRMKEMMG